MVQFSVHAKPYAEAIAIIARVANDWGQWIRDLEYLEALMHEPSVRALLIDPIQAGAVVDRLRGTGVTSHLRPATVQLLTVMAKRRVLALLPDVLAHVRHLADVAGGVRRVTVTSAVALEPEVLSMIQDRIGGSVGQVVVTTVLDPKILGGLVVQEGDRIRDYSVRGRLEALRERMA